MRADSQPFYLQIIDSILSGNATKLFDQLLSLNQLALVTMLNQPHAGKSLLRIAVQHYLETKSTAADPTSTATVSSQKVAEVIYVLIAFGARDESPTPIFLNSRDNDLSPYLEDTDNKFHLLIQANKMWDNLASKPETLRLYYEQVIKPIILPRLSSSSHTKMPLHSDLISKIKKAGFIQSGRRDSSASMDPNSTPTSGSTTLQTTLQRSTSARASSSTATTFSHPKTAEPPLPRRSGSQVIVRSKPVSSSSTTITSPTTTTLMSLVRKSRS